MELEIRKRCDIHDLRFGNPIREAPGGASSPIPAAEKRGPPGATLDLALKYVIETTIRSHHQTFEVRVSDAPGPDEILIAGVSATAERLQARPTPVGAGFAEVVGGS